MTNSNDKISWKLKRVGKQLSEEAREFYSNNLPSQLNTKTKLAYEVWFCLFFDITKYTIFTADGVFYKHNSDEVFVDYNQLYDLFSGNGYIKDKEEITGNLRYKDHNIWFPNEATYFTIYNFVLFLKRHA